MNKLLTLAATAAIAAGCTTAGEHDQYVRTDTALCTFHASGNAPLTILVEASDAWEAVPMGSWLKISDKTDGSFVLTAEDNDSYTEPRESTVELTSGKAVKTISVLQLARENDSPTYRTYGAYDMGAAMSPGGTYTYGTRHILQPDDSYHMYATFFNLDTGEVTEVGPLLYGSPLQLEKPMAVTDQGTAFIYGADNSTVAISVDGDYFHPALPSGNHRSPNVQAVSTDGRYWAGFCWTDVATYCDPVLWVDGTAQVLEKPELNYRQDAAPHQVMARGISHDGSVIYGTQWDNLATGMIYWKDGKLDVVGKDLYKVTPTEVDLGDGTTVTINLIERGIYAFAELQNMSPDGKWIAGTYRDEAIEGQTIVQCNVCPAFYNTETEKTILLTDYPDCKAVGVTDDGLGLIAEGTQQMSSGFVVEIETGVNLGNCTDYIRDTFGITVNEGYITYIPPSGDRCLGTMMTFSAMGVGFTQFSISPRPAN